MLDVGSNYLQNVAALDCWKNQPASVSYKYCSKPCATPQTFLTHTTMSLCALCRFYRRGDRSFRKAEKQRLKAEKRQLKAEVKEIRKQLRMERRGIQWSAAGDGSSSPVLLQPRATQVNSPEWDVTLCSISISCTVSIIELSGAVVVNICTTCTFLQYMASINNASLSENNQLHWIRIFTVPF